MIALAVSLLAPNFVAAHRIGPVTEGFKGTLKNYCESDIFFPGANNTAGQPQYASSTYDGTAQNRDFHNYDETRTHDYGPPALGFLIFNLQDGNLLGNGAANDCDGDGVPADFDRHLEYQQGGATLLARNETLVLPDPQNPPLTYVGGGTWACLNLTADHDEAGRVQTPTVDVYANDLLWGAAVEFFVTSDWSLSGAADMPCGDNFVNSCDNDNDGNTDPEHVGTEGITCNPRDRVLPVEADYSATSQENVGTINFLAGADGTYPVFVGSINAPATQGHVGTQSDDLKKKPNLPGGILLPNVVVAAFLQGGDNGPVNVILNPKFPNCILSREGPGSPPVFPGTSTGRVECGWDFKTSCTGTVLAVNLGALSNVTTAPGAGGDVNVNLRCNPGGALAADATAPPPAPSWDTDSGSVTGVFKTWRCEANFDTYPIGPDVRVTQGIGLCLAPIVTPADINTIVDSLNPIVPSYDDILPP